MSSAFDSKLAKMKNNLALAQQQSEAFQDGSIFPKGIYVGRTTAKLKESEKSGNLFLSRSFVPTSGNLKGVPVFDSLILEHDNEEWALQNQREMCRYISLCGHKFNPNKPSDLPKILSELTKSAPTVKFEVTHSKPNGEGVVYLKVNVLELVTGKSKVRDEDQDEDEGENQPTLDDDDLPDDDQDTSDDDDDDDDDDQDTSDDDDEEEVSENFTDFAVSQGIGITEEMTYEDLVQEVRNHGPYLEEELTAQEIEALKNEGLEDMIEKAKPKAKSKAKVMKKSVPAPVPAQKSKPIAKKGKK